MNTAKHPTVPTSCIRLISIDYAARLPIATHQSAFAIRLPVFLDFCLDEASLPRSTALIVDMSSRTFYGSAMTFAGERLQRLRTAIREHAKSHLLTGRIALDDIDVIEVDSRTMIYIVLKTLLERRRVRLLYRDWKAENLSTRSPEAFDPMAVPVPVPGSIVSKEVEIPLPEQECVIECASCGGRERLPCGLCSGTGFHAGGLCVSCLGACSKLCQACRGNGKRIAGKSLVVTFEARKRSRVVNRGDLPKKVFAGVKVEPALRLEGNPAVEIPNPAQSYRKAHLFGDPAVDSIVRSMIRKSTPVDGEQLVAQRLTVCEIPTLEATYRWSSTQAKLWLLGSGENQKLHAPYPPFDVHARGLLARTLSALKGFRA